VVILSPLLRELGRLLPGSWLSDSAGLRMPAGPGPPSVRTVLALPIDRLGQSDGIGASTKVIMPEGAHKGRPSNIAAVGATLEVAQLRATCPWPDW